MWILLFKKKLEMKFFSNLIRNRDAMGHDVTLNFKGNSKNPTLLGGLMTIVARGLVLLFLFQLLLGLKNMEDPYI